MRSGPRRHLLAASCLALLVLGGTSGCSGDDTDDAAAADRSSAADAHQQACRTYLLTVGRDDLQSVLLLSRAERSGSYTPDDIAGVLGSTIGATAEVAGVEDLPDEDFDRFLALADAAHGARLASTGTDFTISDRSVSALDDAVKAVREACQA